jgi:hypothetical protein
MNRISFEEYLTEMPRIVSDTTDFGLTDIDFNTELNDKFLKSKKTKTLKIYPDHGYKLCQYRNKIFLSDGFKILFYVQYIEKWIPFIKITAISQIRIWRSSTIGIPNLPSYIFFNHIFPIKKIIATDIEQTTDGQRFWYDRISQALEMRLHVYYVNILALNRELIEIKTFTEFLKLAEEKKIWNSEAKLMIISKDKI